MSEVSEVKKCPKCSSANLREKYVRLAGTFGVFSPLEATAYVCDNCGYIEFYER